MTFLELVQAFHREAKLPGTSPAAVTGLTGRAADLAAWTIEAYNDIQRERDGRWKWLLRSFRVDTTSGDDSYPYTACTDIDAAAAISRFRSWQLDDREPPFIYLVSDGEETEGELTIVDWPTFRRRYVRGTHESAFPSVIAADVHDNLRLGPTPDGIYRVTGDYWRGNQVLAADADEPEMPEDYHMLIVWQAMTKYGYNAVARELLARAAAEGARLANGLAENQAYSRFSMQLCGPLA